MLILLFMAQSNESIVCFIGLPIWLGNSTIPYGSYKSKVARVAII